MEDIYSNYVEENTDALLDFIAYNRVSSPGKRNFQSNDSFFSLFMEE